MPKADDGQTGGVTAQAEALLNRAFKHLREAVEGRADEDFGSLFPHGVAQVEIRVDVRLSEHESASIDLTARGNEPPPMHELDYDEFDDPLLYEDEEDVP